MNTNFNYVDYLWDNKKAEARLNRWEIDLTSNSGSIKKDCLDDHIGEFPRLDERYSMSNYRYGIYASNHGNSPKGISFNLSLIHI